MTAAELEQLLSNMESDRVERKESATDMSRIQQAICAFANDMPGHGEPGVLFIGVKDDGACADLAVTDELLLRLAGIRSSGNILPIPAMIVQKHTLQDCEMAVVIVEPSQYPPVRFKGRTWIRVGPQRATATVEEESRLSERRRAKDLPFDLRPIPAATLGDLDVDAFERTYLTVAIAPDVLEQNKRTPEQQLASMRFVTPDHSSIPTVVGLLTVGKTPADFIPGAYVQFLRIDGVQLNDSIADQKECHGPLTDVLKQLDDIINANVRIATDIQSGTTERRWPDYPHVALQQLVRNAVMHRNYESSNAPVRLTWFLDRIEIQKPGGPLGQVTRENFGQPGITDYRNPNVAEVMKTLGYVQRFGVGLQLARKSLSDNGNPPPEFDVQENHVLVIVRIRK